MFERSGKCLCGCGRETSLAIRTDKRRGNVKGEPQKYVRGHATRKERQKCTAEGCTREATATYCRKHSERMRLYGDLIGRRPKGAEEFRFWFRVDKSGDCWTWSAARGAGKFDYGYFWTDGKKLVKAHRYAYALANGPIPEGMVICHRCDNPPCVRPDHLFLGTQKDNIHDMDAKGRGRRPTRRTHCPKGHPYDEANTALRTDGAQACRTCRKLWHETSRARRVAETAEVACPRCGATSGRPCTSRFGAMADVHDARVSSAREAIR